MVQKTWFKALGWCFRRNWFLESAQHPGDLGLTNLQINALEDRHPSVAVVTHTTLRCWTETSLVVLRTSTLRGVILEGIVRA